MADLGFDACEALTCNQVGEICRWRTRDDELATATARAEAVRPAKRVSALDEDITVNATRMTELVNASHAAPLLKKSEVLTGDGSDLPDRVGKTWPGPL